MGNLIKRVTGLAWENQSSAFLVALGHSGTHWIIGIIYIVLPFISKELRLSYAEAGGLITIFHVSAFLANAGSGIIVDITERRIVIQCVALILGGLAFLGCAFSTDFLTLSMMIILVGITNNLWHPAAISFLSLKFPKNKGYALSVHSLGANLGDTIAPLMVGSMLVWTSWNNVIVIGSTPVFLIAVWIALVMSDVPNSSHKPRPSNSYGKNYFKDLAKMVKNRAILGLCLMSGFRSMTQNGLLVFIPLFLINVLGAGPIVLGLGIMAMQVAGLFAGPIAGILSDTLGRKKIVLAGLFLTTVLTILSAFISHVVLFIIIISFLGFALFAVRPVIHSWLMDLTPDNLGGSATSLLFATQSGLSALIPLGGGIIADIWGLNWVFLVLSVFILLGATLGIFITESRARAEF